MGVLGLAPFYENLVFTAAICGTLLSIAFRTKILDRNGTLLALAMGLAVGGLGHVTWLLVLLIFLFAAYVATKHRFREKKKLHVAQTQGGRRGAENVLANGYVAVIVAALSFPYPAPMPPISFERHVGAILFLTSIAVAASDTFASELGVFARRAVDILRPWRQVPAGTNGGVSGLGQLAALGGAGLVTGTGWLLLTVGDPSLGELRLNLVWIPFVLGFVGCQVDSILGSTLENRGILSGSHVNLLSIFLGTVVAYLLTILLG